MININYTYYNNIELLEKVIDHYKPLYSNKFFRFTIIDDGSNTFNALTEKNMPEPWNVIRVEQDLGWGNEMSRNILMNHTPVEWNALMDLDYVIDLNNLQSIIENGIKYYNQLTPAYKFCLQFDKGRRYNYFDPNEMVDDGGWINSFIISKTVWKRTYGYDQAFGYQYGIDYTLFRQLSQELILPDSKLIKLALQGAPDDKHNPQDEAAFNEHYKAVSRFIDMGLMTPEGKWKNHGERMKLSIKLPEYKFIRWLPLS